MKQVAGIPLAVVKHFLRVVLISGILAYFAAAAGLLVARYWLLPRIDQWRPEIEQAISKAVGTPVRFDAMSADWRGLNANLKITNLTILDNNGVAQLGVPAIDAILSWRSLLSLEPVFRYIGVEDVILVARRSPEGQMYVAGFELESDDQNEAGFWQSATMRWLLKQGRVNIQNSRLVWIDQQRKAVPLVVQDIDMSLDNTLLGHKLAMKVNLPPAMGGGLELVAEIDSVSGSLSRLIVDEPDGYVYANVAELFPQAVRPWVDLPAIEGSFGARLWLDILDGELTNFTASLAGRDASFKPSAVDQEWFSVGEFRWQASGPLALLGLDAQFPGLVEAPKSRQRLSGSLSVADGWFGAPAAGMQPIEVDQLSADLSVSRPTLEGLQVDVHDMAFANPDGLVTARGTWQLDNRGKGGYLDIEGTLARFKLPKLLHYLPGTIDTEARDWLATAFTSGTVPSASFEVNGLVDDFPFSAGSGAGTLRIDGSIQDWSVNYAPVSGPDEMPWPLLTDMNGRLDLLNDRIAVEISSGSLTLPKGERINVSRLSAELTDLENNPVLTLSASTDADAQDYLALFDQTALRDLAPGFVRGFEGHGQWSMPLALRVPITDLDSTTFRGELEFNGGTLTHSGSPLLTEMKGAAIITHTGFESKNLSGNLLGGSIEISGGVTDTIDTITGSGELTWTALAKYTGSQIMADLLKGEMAYNLSATVKDENLELTLGSDLASTQIVLPAPLGLSTGQKAQTRLQWQADLTGKRPERWSLSVANRLNMTASTFSSTDNRRPSFFRDVNLALGTANPKSGDGFTVAVQLPSVTLSDWLPAIEKITRELQAPARAGPSLFPPFVSAQLQTKQFLMDRNSLENVSADLTVRNGRQYTVNIASSQTNGSVQWALDQGRLQDGYHVRLDRLDIGNHDHEKSDHTQKDSRDATSLPEPGTLSNLPMLDIEIKDLTFYGARLGELKIAGRNTANQQQWQISKLQIVNPYAELNATGSCRFDSNPGIVLDAELKITDLGELTKFARQGEQVRKGSGTIKANIEWQRFPWQFDYGGMSGKVALSLQEGVFDHVNSSSARVLELLSMQSLNRILNANINPGESFAQGFPWSSINGEFEIRNGVIDTQNLTVNSPVATISLTGNSSLVDQTFNLDAVVRPNLDMSGTAVATGFLLNPIVGLSALVGQYLLRTPVEAVLSQRYHVGGTWEDPKISEGPDPNVKAEPQGTQPDIRN